MNHDIKKNGISRHDSDPGWKSFEVGRIPEKKVSKRCVITVNTKNATLNWFSC